MDEDLVINPDWSERRQNRCAAFRFLFQWELNPTDDMDRDLEYFLNRLGKKESFLGVKLPGSRKMLKIACMCCALEYKDAAQATT